MCAAITTAAIGVGLAAYQVYQGAQDKKEAKRALNDFKRQDLTNPYENMQISTVGTDAMREEAGRTSANLVESSKGDIRSVMGNIPQIVALNNDMNRGIQTDLDMQVQKRNYAIANQKVNNQGVQEGRDNADLSGIGTQLNVGRQDMWNGMRGLMTTANYAANNIDFKGTGPEISKAVNLQPIGSNSVITNSLPKLQTSPLPKTEEAIFRDYWNNNFYGF